LVTFTCAACNRRAGDVLHDPGNVVLDPLWAAK
jgi:hypothetical protein